MKDNLGIPLQMEIYNYSEKEQVVYPFSRYVNEHVVKETYKNKENKTQLNTVNEIIFQSKDMRKFWFEKLNYIHKNGTSVISAPFCAYVDPYQSQYDVIQVRLNNANPINVSFIIPPRTNVTISAYESISGTQLQATSPANNVLISNVVSKLSSVLVTNTSSEEIQLDLFNKNTNKNLQIDFVVGDENESDFNIGLTGVYSSNSSQVINPIFWKNTKDNIEKELTPCIDPYQMTSNIIMHRSDYQKTNHHSLITTILPNTTVMYNMWITNPQNEL